MIITEQKQFHQLNQSIQCKKYRRNLFKQNTKIFITESGTFVTQIDNLDKNTTTLQHSDINGQKIFQYTFNTQFKRSHFCELIMIAKDKIIIFEREQNRLTQINLTTHQVNHLHHSFMKNLNSVKLFFFSETNFLCVQQSSNPFLFSWLPYHLKITYYCLPLALETKSWTYYQQNDIKNIQLSAQKANNQSLIAWLFDKQQYKLAIGLFDLRDQPKGQYRRINFQINQNLQLQFLLSSLKWENGYCIYNLWQKKQGTFLFTLQKEREPEVIYYEVKVLRLQIQSKHVSESKIKINFLIIQSISVFHMGEFCIFITHAQFQPQYEKKHIIYVNNRTEEIIAMDQLIYIREVQYSSFYSPEYNYNILYNILYSKSTKICREDSLIVTTKYIFNWQLVTLHFLLYLNQNFDDDLLKDTVEIIKYSQQQCKYERQERQMSQHSQERQMSQHSQEIICPQFQIQPELQIQEESWEQLQKLQIQLKKRQYEREINKNWQKILQADINM